MASTCVSTNDWEMPITVLFGNIHVFGEGFEFYNIMCEVHRRFALNISHTLIDVCVEDYPEP